jgi:hypothetical protein
MANRSIKMHELHLRYTVEQCKLLAAWFDAAVPNNMLVNGNYFGMNDVETKAASNLLLDLRQHLVAGSRK